MDAPSAGDGSAGTRLTRRALLGAAGAAAAAGVAAPAAAQMAGSGPAQVPDFGDWFGGDALGGETTSFTAVADRRGEDAVTVEVGASGNGGTYAYAPTALWIDPGTTVTFEWTSNTHNVVVEDQPDGADWAGHENVEDAGFSFSHTFETGGLYDYYCNPHLSLGMKGAVAVGDDVPLTSPPGSGGAITLPGGDTGASFLGVLLGTAGLAAAIVLAGEFYGTVMPEDDGPRSAHAAALLALAIGVVALLVVVARLFAG